VAEPFIFIGTHTLKEGKFEDFRANCLALAEVVEAEEPRMIAFNVYANENGTEVSVVQVHPDTESMMFHMQMVRQHITEAYADSLQETTSMAVYGPPNDDVFAMMTQLASPGVPVSAKPRHPAGFTRSAAV
jgi:quinol monooxygenase YgiN